MWGRGLGRAGLRRRVQPVVGLLLGLACVALPASAQEVRGRFRSSADGTPLASALVSLVDGNGAVAVSALTNASGWFSLPASPGAYTLRAEHVGYATQTRTVSVAEGGVTWVELEAPFQAIELEGLTAEVDKACSLPPDVAQRLVSLWDEVSKALRVTEYVEGEGGYLFEVERWRRTLEPQRLRVEEESRRPGTGMHPGSPFVSLPPEELAEEGYIQGKEGANEIRYYGPDARVLVHPSFQATHCFALAPKPHEEEGWVGIGFRPRDTRARDIEGTLWLDPETYEPQRLEYRYPVLPWPLVTDKVGGRVEFARLPEGPWIVRRWYIRMPVVAQGQLRIGPGSRPRDRYALASVLEDGGEVLRAESAQVVTFGARTATLDGVVVDSAGGTPLAGAQVRVVGTFLLDTTDAHGRFGFPQVPRGRYAVAVSTGGLADLGAELPVSEVDIVPPAPAHLEVRVPSLRAMAARQCGDPLGESGDAVVRGRVVDVAGTPFPGGRIQVTWEEVAGITSSGQGRQSESSVSVAREGHAASLGVGPDGRFTACGLPEEIPVTFVATAPGYRGRPVRVTAGRGSLEQVTLALETAEETESLLVQVVAPDGRTPVEAAHVALPELGRSAVTDANGSVYFPRVAVGDLLMEVTHLAYLSRTDTVTVAREGRTVAQVALADEALEIEPIVVEVRTPETEARRQRGASGSAAISAPEIQEAIRTAKANNVAEVIRAVLPTGVRISPMVRGSNYVGTCIESTRGGLIRRKAGGARRCLMVQVVLDGGYLSTLEAARLVENFPLLDIVSIEFLSPMDQTFQYGTSDANGMLIIRTSR